MSFKLIGIRPLKSKCNSKFLKSLESNYIYQFYQNYTFYSSKDEIMNYKVVDDDIKNIEKVENGIDSLYDFKVSNPLTGIERYLHVNISAIVGKNGSGKSSLLELLYVAFYKMSRICGIIDFKPFDILQVQNKLIETNKLIEKKIFSNEDLELFESSVSDLHENFEKILKCEKNKRKYDKNTNDIRVEFIYSINNIIYLLRLDNDIITLKKISNSDTCIIDAYDDFKNNLNSLFYNLVINYSLYGLNSEESGDWIEKIFHKNDSYQTPIVLNPFRDKGRIDINSENYLVRSRLLSILFDKSMNNKQLANNKTVNRIKLSYIEKSTTDYGSILIDFKSKIFPELYRKFFNKNESFKFEYKYGALYEKTLEYILRKITLIPERYPSFIEFYNENNFLEPAKIDDFIVQLFLDRSHITLKLRQALNFYEYQNYLNDDIISEAKIFSIKEIENKINSYDCLFEDLIDLVPPSFFKFELYFDDSNDDNNFSNLSSGEKQKIFSLNSILYHLRNLISVNFNAKQNSLLVYNNFNIILDEIELYYHPELQRTFIFDLLEYLKKINYDSLELLPNINIIFVTHSPFILSDIPSTNILYLKIENNKSIAIHDRKKSFGANIHELLGDNFFLGKDEIFMGEFARVRISDTIKWLNEIINEKKKYDADKANIYLELCQEKNNYLKIIEIIDEPIIKEKLIEMYSGVFGNELRKKHLMAEMNKIKTELDGL